MLDSRPLSEQIYEDVLAYLEQDQGEGLTLDYKRQLDSSTPAHKAELCKDISALANSQGGMIFYGVDEYGDDRKPVLPPCGTNRTVNNRQPIQEWAAQVLSAGIQPSLSLEYAAFDLPDEPGKCVLVIRVAQSPAAPHMVTSKNDNRYYGRFYRRYTYENRIAEEYEVREMLERARRLYLGREGELARRGYGDVHSPEFGINSYSARLVDRYTKDENRHPVRAQMWASLIMLPTNESVKRVNRHEWYSWLQPNSLRYEPNTGGVFLPIVPRPIQNGVACVTESHPDTTKLESFLLVSFDGTVELAWVPAIHERPFSGTVVNYFQGGELLDTIWQFVSFSRDVHSRLGIAPSGLLAVNLIGTRDAYLAQYASGWASPIEQGYLGGYESKCLDENIQIRRDLDIEDFDSVRNSTRDNVPRVVEEIAEDICASFGIRQPVLMPREQWSDIRGE